MASSVATDKFVTRNKVEFWYHAPADAATKQSVKAGAATTTWADMRGYHGFVAAALTALKVGNGMIELSIYAAEDSTGTNATEIKTSGVLAADAIGDWAILECTEEEIAHVGEAAGYNLRYVAAYVDCHHNDDEVAVVYIRTGGTAYDAMTPATTIA